MSADTVDAETFRERWDAHVDQLDRLKLALDEEQAEVLEDTQDQLRAIVDAAVANREAEA